jgi:translation initiation factor eIF-2B subunit beta
MQRVNKLVLGVDAILKNGGLLMHPGTYLLCLAAHQFSIPVIALSGTHKLTSKYAFE